MKTTVEIPDDLMYQVKLRALQDRRKLKEEIADLLRRGLTVPTGPSAVTPRRETVRLPLFSTRPDAPARSMRADALLEIERESEALLTAAAVLEAAGDPDLAARYRAQAGPEP